MRLIDVRQDTYIKYNVEVTIIKLILIKSIYVFNM